MKEFRPQQVAAKPLFLVTFTVIGVVYTAWLSYEYFVLKEPVNWNGIAFVIGVIILLWYTRLSKAYYLRIGDDRIEWKMNRKPKETALTSEIQEIVEQSYGVDVLMDTGWKDVNLEAFGKGSQRDEVLSELESWANKKNISFEKK